MQVDDLRTSRTTSVATILLVIFFLYLLVPGYVFELENWISEERDIQSPDELRTAIDETYTALEAGDLQALEGDLSLQQARDLHEQTCERNSSECPENITAAAIDTVYRSAHPALLDRAASYLYSSQLQAIEETILLPAKQNAYRSIASELHHQTRVLTGALACSNESMDGRTCYRIGTQIIENNTYIDNVYMSTAPENESSDFDHVFGITNMVAARHAAIPHPHLAQQYQIRLLYGCTRLIEANNLTTIEGIETSADTRPGKIRQCIEHRGTKAATQTIRETHTALGD